MAIGTPYASSSEWYGNTNSTEEDVTCSANVSEGDLAVIMTYLSNEGDTATDFPDASVTGFTHIDQFQPGSTYRGIVDVLAKYITGGEDGTSPTYEVEFNYASNYGKIVMVTVVPGASIDGITVNMAQFSGSSVTFPSDSQDHTIHLLGNNANDVDLDSDFPTGDTGITWCSTGSWRQAGFAHSGGNTSSGSFPSSVAGTFGTIHLSEAVAPAAVIVPTFRYT